ncbi:MAG: transporter substrate-binding domain-containing protein [Alphaproteobacteria bacterium]|nr:transporter substrate-binding domain-containing protein [Alphaproteobacteria bacterium]
MMKRKIWMSFLLIGTVAMLPFVTVAKQPKTQANGMFVPEEEKSHQEVQVKIAECGFSRPIRVATTSNNRPFGWAEWQRTIAGASLASKGFGMEVFKELAQKLKLRYQVFGYASDQEAINELKRGNLDLLIGIYAPNSTVGRGAVTVFPALFSNVFSVYYPADRAFEVHNYSSLHNKKGVIRRVENIYPLFSEMITEDMPISLETTEAAFKKLLSGEADYLIGSPYSIEAELRRYKLHERIVSSGKALPSATMFMVLTRATDCFKLKDALGEALAEYNADPKRADRQIRKVIDEWGERFRDAPGMNGINSNNEEESKIN